MRRGERLSFIDEASADELIYFLSRYLNKEKQTIDFWFDKWIFHIQFLEVGLTDLCIYKSVEPKYAARQLARELLSTDRLSAFPTT